MQHAPGSIRLIACVAACASIGAGAANAQTATAVAPDGSPGGAVAACERAAMQTLAAPHGRSVEVSFDPAPAVQSHLSGDNQTVLRGAGRWRGEGGTHTFTYSCNVDPRNLEAVGVVLRDATRPAAPKPAPAPLEPDLSSLSPAACESSAAEALQQRWPRVAKISFDRDTRSFRQPSAILAELHGTGWAQPGPGARLTFFGFDCAIDPRDGQVLRTSVSG
ncbi:MAG: hypothetical protein ABI364_05665 [Caldimonas sp.]